MHRVYEFLRRHGPWVDGVLGLVLLVPAVSWAVSGGGPEGRTATLVSALALWVVVALRRVMPERMLLLAIGTGAFQLVFDAPPSPASVGYLVIIYTVAGRNVRWASRTALVAALVAPALSTVRWPSTWERSDLSVALFNTLLITLCFALAWVLGDSLRTRRAYYAELEERATRLERERERESRMAVAAERARIARELHDVVAHNVSVMVVQADGAAYVLDTAPEQSRTALGTISTTGRQALAEMRRLLGVLRDDGPGEGTARDGSPAGWVPQPGLEQLTDLVEQARLADMTVDLRCEGQPRPLPSGVELTAYRIVQEALTNSRKHGGAGVSATVRLAYGVDQLTVRVEDDGRGSRADLAAETGADGQGHGLIGMRERVGMVGGELTAAPRPGGGFRVRATLPLSGECRAAAVEGPRPARAESAGADPDPAGQGAAGVPRAGEGRAEPGSRGTPTEPGREERDVPGTDPTEPDGTAPGGTAHAGTGPTGVEHARAAPSEPPPRPLPVCRARHTGRPVDGAAAVARPSRAVRRAEGPAAEPPGP